ncbi:metallophosphoesterase [Halovivax cerinus]|uniref:Metallophosphoesterase n=1 Tax=Halovivax cerinus TaxID=1487865 RepID=A0ABD5NN25_9EURY|nr:metallophosphoesterase [Halovivax cerinus]
MHAIEPVPDEPAAIGTVDDERALFVADYHAGVEAALRYERGVQVPSRADERRERLCRLVDETGVDRLVVLGDLMHSIGDPGGAERGELEVLFESLPPIPVTLVKGNHDGAIETWLGETIAESSRGPPAAASTGVIELDVLDGEGGRLGDIGVCHGHSWPAAPALEADVLCLGHEHPCVRLEDEVGGSRVEPVWFRGTLDRRWAARRSPHVDAGTDAPSDTGRSTDDGVSPNASSSDSSGGVVGREPDPIPFVAFPAFNDLVGGTWINVEGQSFLSPVLPGGLETGEAYLLDGTRLGPYHSI